MRDFFEFLGVGACVCGALVTLFLLLFGLIAVVEWHQCGSYEKVTAKPTKYEGLRCYVEHNGVWYSWEEYKPRLRLTTE
jgi:hypothetical protein